MSMIMDIMHCNRHLSHADMEDVHLGVKIIY